jgi:hypothetical protein
MLASLMKLRFSFPGSPLKIVLSTPFIFRDQMIIGKPFKKFTLLVMKFTKVGTTSGIRKHPSTIATDSKLMIQMFVAKSLNTACLVSR